MIFYLVSVWFQQDTVEKSVSWSVSILKKKSEKPIGHNTSLSNMSILTGYILPGVICRVSFMLDKRLYNTSRHVNGP